MRLETLLAARPAVRAITASKIRELVNEGPGNPDVLPFWVGEPDEPTPDFIRRAGIDSISWLMTGWRLGWLVVPEALAADLGKLIEYNTSCAPVFVQRAGIAAVTHGEPVVAHTLERFRKARDFLSGELAGIPGVEFARPPGTMYAFLRVAGVADSLGFCKRLVREEGLGLAPGSAFGPHGEGFVRWCFATSLERLAEGVARLRRGLAS